MAEIVRLAFLEMIRKDRVAEESVEGNGTLLMTKQEIGALGLTMLKELGYPSGRSALSAKTTTLAKMISRALNADAKTRLDPII